MQELFDIGYADKAGIAALTKILAQEDKLVRWLAFVIVPLIKLVHGLLNRVGLVRLDAKGFKLNSDCDGA